MQTPLETSFGVQVTPWHDFYAMTGGAAASFLGLVFVALALNPMLLSERGPIGFRVWAAQTVNNLVTLVIISLFCLMPNLNHPQLAVGLIILGAINILWGFKRHLGLRENRGAPYSPTTWIIRVVFPLIAFLLLIYVGYDMLDGTVTSMGHLVVSVFLFVIGAAGAAWEMLIEIGRRQARGEDQAPATAEPESAINPLFPGPAFLAPHRQTAAAATAGGDDQV